MSTGGAVETRPHNSPETTDQIICSRAGCTREATLTWTERVTGETLSFCAEDGVAAFDVVIRWQREPEAQIHVETHALAVEKAIGRGLYDQPMRWRQPPTQP